MLRLSGRCFCCCCWWWWCSTMSKFSVVPNNLTSPGCTSAGCCRVRTGAIGRRRAAFQRSLEHSRCSAAGWDCETRSGQFGNSWCSVNIQTQSESFWFDLDHHRAYLFTLANQLIDRGLLTQLDGIVVDEAVDMQVLNGGNLWTHLGDIVSTLVYLVSHGLDNCKQANDNVNLVDIT